MKIHRIWLLAFIASFSCQIVVTRADDVDDSVRMFNEYLHIDSLLSHQHQSERTPPPHVIADFRKKRDQIAQDLLSKQDEAGPALAKEYLETLERGGSEMPSQLMTFALQTGIARTEFLAFAREAIRSTNLDSPRDPMLSVALEYLGEEGEEEDLVLMSRLDGHINQTYAQIRDRFAVRLKARLTEGASKAGGDASKPQDSTVAAGHSGYDAPADAAKEKGSSSVPGWLIAIISVLVLFVVILLARTLNRNRRTPSDPGPSAGREPRG